MKKNLLILAIAGVFTACGNRSDSSDNSMNSDSTVNSTTPPSTKDTSTIGRMMGDTTKLEGDSLK